MSHDQQVARLELLVSTREIGTLERLAHSLASRRDVEGLSVVHAQLEDLVVHVEELLGELDDPQGVV